METYLQKPAALRPMRLQPGYGVQATVNALGNVAGGRQRPGVYLHPFKPTLRGAKQGKVGMSFSMGLVGFREPTIDGVHISGRGKPQPVLVLDPEVANEKGESWCCVDVRPDLDGKITDRAQVYMVHAKSPYSATEKVGRFPVVLVLWKNSKPWQIHEVALFNAGYENVVPTQGPERHFFP